MVNCKKCGALIGQDFVFCGKCGEPVKNSINNRMVANVKKHTKLRSLRKKISDSDKLNFIFAGIVFFIGLLFLNAAFVKLNRISSLYWSMGGIYNQYLLKYEYIKEGLSLSYAAKEYIQIVDYVFLWIFSILFVIAAAALLTVFVTRLLRGINIIRKKERKTTVFDRIEFIAGIIIASAVVCCLIGMLIEVYLKGRV